MAGALAAAQRTRLVTMRVLGSTLHSTSASTSVGAMSPGKVSCFGGSAFHGDDPESLSIRRNLQLTYNN